MPTNVKIILDTRKQKQDKTHPLILRIIHNRKSAQISLGYSILEKDWDEKKGQVKKSCNLLSNITRLNNLLQQQKAHAFEVITKLEDSGKLKNLSIQEVKKKIVNKTTQVSFFEFTEQMIEEMKSVGRIGSSIVYKGALSSVKKFRNNKDFYFNELNFKFLKDFENYFLRKNSKPNTISSNMRMVRAVYNRAIKEDYASKELYPFSDYKIKHQKTKKRAVRAEVINKIEALKLPKKSNLWHAQNYFLFSFYMMGISFIDLAYLRVDNIHDGRIEYVRRKTKKLYNVKIIPKAQEILNFYLKGKKGSDYIFPIIKPTDNVELEYKTIRHQNVSYNKQLNEIGKKCGIETNLTSYVVRHSWATIAKRKGVPTAVISEGLGHESESITQVYLDSFDKEVLDGYNEMITG